MVRIKITPAIVSILAVSSLALASTAQAQPSTCNGRSLSNGGTIVPQNTPGTVSGTVTSSQGVYYTVTASAAASYTFTFCSNGGSSSYDSWLCLYNSSGALITQNDDSCGLSSQIIASLAAGTYYIAVSGFSSSSGSYTMAYFAPGVVPNSPPAAPASLTQASSSGGSALAEGSLAGNPVYFRANVTDPNAGNTVGLQVEALPTTSLFQTTITGPNAQTPANALVASGGVAEASIPSLPDGSWHWRARGFDNGGAFGPWVEFSPAGASFFIDETPPSAPTPPYDPSSTTVRGPASKQSVGFGWGQAVDAGPPLPLTYFLDVSFDPSFATVDIATTTLSTTFSASLSATDQDYYWRVRATDAAGNVGPFAGPFTFKVQVEEAPEEPPEDILPCAAGVKSAGWTPILGLLLAGVLLIGRRLRI